MSTPERSFIIRGYTPAAAIAIGILAYIVVFWLLNRRYGLSESLRVLLNRFAPAFLIVAPPIITYGFVCGFASLSFGVFCDRFLAERIGDRESFYLPVFKGFEYASGVGMSYVWIRFVKWLGLPAVWPFLVLLNHGLVAGYRETRSDFGRVFGPTVSDHFMVLDALIPFVALLVYAFFHLRKKPA